MAEVQESGHIYFFYRHACSVSRRRGPTRSSGSMRPHASASARRLILWREHTQPQRPGVLTKAAIGAEDDERGDVADVVKRRREVQRVQGAEELNRELLPSPFEDRR